MKDKALYETIVHEIGHALFAMMNENDQILRTLVSVKVSSDYFCLHGETFAPISDESIHGAISLLQAGLAMESVVLDRKIVNRRGTDTDRTKLLSPGQQYTKQIQEELIVMFRPFKNAVKDFATRLTNAPKEDNVNFQIFVTNDQLKELIKSAKAWNSI